MTTLLVGSGSAFQRVDDAEWRMALAGVRPRMQSRLAFMSPEHHTVRYFVVRELPRAGKPLAVDAIAAGTELPRARVDALLNELQRNLFFLVRNPSGDVAWAFPVTAEPTAHRLQFDSGERLWGA